MAELKRYKYNEVPSYLETKTYCKENRLSLKGVEPVGERYQFKSRQWVKLYDIRNLEKKKPATEKQLAALQKASIARKEKYTCKRCNEYNLHTVDRETSLCKHCSEIIFEMQLEVKAYQERLLWTSPEFINNYVILDVQTTGLYPSCDEVVEIAIIDLTGKVLFNSLIKPDVEIDDEAHKIHGITDDMLSNAHSLNEVFDEIDSILNNKTILAYNAEFDSSMLSSNLRKYNLEKNYKWKCVMENVMTALGSRRRISLDEVTRRYGDGHRRALERCMRVKDLISDRQLIQDKISNKLSLIEKYL